MSTVIGEQNGSDDEDGLASLIGQSWNRLIADLQSIHSLRYEVACAKP